MPIIDAIYLGGHRMEGDKSTNLSSILESSMLELKQTNEDAYNLIIEKAKEGFFANHQTAGGLKKLAKEILDVSAALEKKDES